MRPLDLLKILAVPGTDQPLNLVVSELAYDEPYNGWVEDQNGRVWGRLEAYRFHFVKFQPVTNAERDVVLAQGPTQVLIPISTFIDPFDERILSVGDGFTISNYLRGFHGNDMTEFFAFRSRAPRIDVQLHAHGWSGYGLVEVDEGRVYEIDLFNRENAIVHTVTIDNPDHRERIIKLRPSGRAAPGAQGRQLILEGFVEYGDDLIVPAYKKPTSRNRGGEFRPKFFETLDTLESTAIVLDVGGGKRQLDDVRYLNLDYSLFEEPDIFGDGMALPFRSNSIDFVYTAAVLEHVRDPLLMGREIYRVLKSGGKILANSAFMQPVHSEGQHFFNATPYGIDLIFEHFSDRAVWWETGFKYTMEWFIKVSQVTGIVEQDKIDKFLSLAAEIEPHISDARGMYLASGVWLSGKKIDPLDGF